MISGHIKTFHKQTNKKNKHSFQSNCSALSTPTTAWKNMWQLKEMLPGQSGKDLKHKTIQQHETSAECRPEMLCGFFQYLLTENSPVR